MDMPIENEFDSLSLRKSNADVFPILYMLNFSSTLRSRINGGPNKHGSGKFLKMKQTGGSEVCSNCAATSANAKYSD